MFFVVWLVTFYPFFEFFVVSKWVITKLSTIFHDPIKSRFNFVDEVLDCPTFPDMSVHISLSLSESLAELGVGASNSH